MATKTNTTDTLDTDTATPASPSPESNAVATPLQTSVHARVRVLKHRAEFLGCLFAAGHTLDIPADEARRLQSLGIVEIIG